MDSLDIVARWRRDIAIADNGGDVAAQRSRGDMSATIRVAGRHELTTENDEAGRRTGMTGED
ncbi:hypothetical protein ACFYO7_29835 [Nocardia salmonicida]|uniref:hypothetical protein n=1 Tax=Nocardia salmonicida TaxID=53431 RepID=UPI0036AC4211